MSDDHKRRVLDFQASAALTLALKRTADALEKTHDALSDIERRLSRIETALGRDEINRG